MDTRLRGTFYLIAPVEQIENRNREYDHCSGQGDSLPFHENDYTRRLFQMLVEPLHAQAQHHYPENGQRQHLRP